MTEQSSTTPAWTATSLRENPHAAADKPERVRRMFASIAHRYDLNNRLHSFFQDQRWRRRAVALAEVPPGGRVLDVACGTGDLTEAFARSAAGTVIGVDFTAEMLDRAKEKAGRRRSAGDANGGGGASESHRGPGRPEYRLGDAMDLEFEDASFDVVSIAFGIRNVGVPARALAEFRRVLRPGGRLVILEFTEPRNRLLRAGNHLYCRHVMPFTAGLIAGDRAGAYRYLPRSVATFADHLALAELVRSAGFTVLVQELQTFGVCAITVAEAAGPGQGGVARNAPDATAGTADGTTMR